MFRNRRRPRRILHRPRGLNSFRKNRKVKRGNAVEKSSKIKPKKSPGALVTGMSLVIQEVRIGRVGEELKNGGVVGGEGDIVYRQLFQKFACEGKEIVKRHQGVSSIAYLFSCMEF